MHQPFASVVKCQDKLLAEAMECYQLAGLTPSTERGKLLVAMDALVHLVSGYRFKTALRRLRENP